MGWSSSCIAGDALTIAEARALVQEEEADKLLDNESIIRDAIDNVENNGIVFLDEIDKICARGEIRGGRFVSGFLGEQFARPEALDLLRHIRRSGPATTDVEVSPTDPLNLTGVVIPGARTAAQAGTAVRIIHAEKSQHGAA